MAYLKHSSKMYRNIKGRRYEQYTSNPDLFQHCKEAAKNLGLKTKIIKGELFIEKTQY